MTKELEAKCGALRLELERVKRENKLLTMMVKDCNEAVKRAMDHLACPLCRQQHKEPLLCDRCL